MLVIKKINNKKYKVLKTITLSEDHLKLIPFLFLEEDDEKVVLNKKVALSLQSHVLDDVSLILGMRDKAIPTTINDAEGIAFPDDVEEYLLKIYHDVTDNLLEIEEIIHQFVIKGGITSGTYSFSSADNMWHKVD